MFVKELDKFKKEVENTIQSFFQCTPEELTQMRMSMLKFYGTEMDECDYKDMNPSYRDELMKYKTVKYFDNVYAKLLELEGAIKNDNK